MRGRKPLDKNSDEFGTPDWLFHALDQEFKFTTDAAASKENAKCIKFYTLENSAFRGDFSGDRVFCNPPYSKGNVELFFHLGREWTRQKDCLLWVLLIPTYTEREWYHNYRNQFEVRFIRRRVQFIGGETSARGNHMLVIFRNPKLAWWSP